MLAGDAQRPQPDYSSSQSSSEWLGSEYELSHCNKPHLVTGSHYVDRLCKQDTQKHHYREIGNKAQALESSSQVVCVTGDESTNTGLTKWKGAGG